MMKTIGFAGTAKNTGKTTTALAVIKQAREAGLSVGITSIGFDGENRDNITGLPKPRYTLQTGDLVATADQCLAAGTAQLETLETTSIETILGKIVLCKVTVPGTTVVAGPTRERDLVTIIERFRFYNVDLLLVDGALNRLVPMIACDGLVLATGAAFEQDIRSLAEHAKMLVELFSLPTENTTVEVNEQISLVFRDGTSTNLKTSSLLGAHTVDEIINLITKPLVSLTIPGACHPALVKSLLEKNPHPDPEFTLILGTPLKLIASGGLPLWHALIAQSGIKIHYQRNLPLQFLTINPFFPKLRPQTGFYTSAYIDKNFLLRTVRTVLGNFPVYDLFQTPQPDLLKLVGVRQGERIEA
jgi:hypothetical protein